MHYYQFNIADYRKDTGHLSTIEHGIYRQLIDWYYLDEKPIPKETQVVMRRLRLGSDELHLLENVLSDFFNLTDNGYVHNRIEAELIKYQTQFAKNRVNGMTGGRPRKTQVVNSENHMATQTEPKITLTNNHKPITNNHIKNIRGSRLPNDWIAPQEFIDYCKTNRPDLDANFIAEGFKDYWISQAGSKAVRADWLATWRNWVRRQDVSKSNHQKPMKGHGVISDEKFNEWLEPKQEQLNG